jgi:hypothetical protein
MSPVFRKTKKPVEETMSIQKKSLISTLKTAKKANVAGEVKSEKISSMRVPYAKAAVSAKASLSAKTVASTRASFKTLKSTNLKSAKAAS